MSADTLLDQIVKASDKIANAVEDQNALESMNRMIQSEKICVSYTSKGIEVAKKYGVEEYRAGMMLGTLIHGIKTGQIDLSTIE